MGARGKTADDGNFAIGEAIGGERGGGLGLHHGSGPSFAQLPCPGWREQRCRKVVRATAQASSLEGPSTPHSHARRRCTFQPLIFPAARAREHGAALTLPRDLCPQLFLRSPRPASRL